MINRIHSNDDLFCKRNQMPEQNAEVKNNIPNRRGTRSYTPARFVDSINQEDSKLIAGVNTTIIASIQNIKKKQPLNELGFNRI